MAILQKPKEDAQYGLFDVENEGLAPAGTWPAVILDIRDKMGVERKKFKGEGTEVVDLTAFLFGYRTPDGKAWRIDTRPMKISGHPKATLYKFLAKLLGKAPEYGWDYMALKGTKCLLTVAHATPEGGGEVYARIDAAVPFVDFGAWGAMPAAPGGTTTPQPKPAAPVIPIADDDENDEIPF